MKTLTIEVAMVIKNAFEMPEFWKKVVPSKRGEDADQLLKTHAPPQVTTGEVRTVEDEVDTGELLPRLDEDAGEGTEEDLVVGRAEAVGVGALAAVLLLLERSADVGELSLDLGVVLGERREAGEGSGSLGVAAGLDEPTGGLGEVEHADGEDEGPDELNGDGDAPGGVVVAVLGRVVDDGGEEETDGDGPLVAGDDGAADPLGGALGLVHGDEGGDETDTETGEDTADDEGGEVEGTGLEGDAEAEDEA